MRILRVLTSVLIVLMLLSAPLMALDSDAAKGKSFTEGESAASFAASRLMTGEEFNRIDNDCAPDVIIKALTGLILDDSEDIEQISIELSRLTFDSAISEEVAAMSRSVTYISKVTGTFEGEFESLDEIDVLSVPMSTGELVPRINNYLGKLSCGETFTAECTFSYFDYIDSRYYYQEASDMYVLDENDQREFVHIEADFTITKGDRVVTFNIDTMIDELTEFVYNNYNVSPTEPAPVKCDEKITVIPQDHWLKMYGRVNLEEHTMMMDEAKYLLDVKSRCLTHVNIKPDGNQVNVSPKAGILDIASKFAYEDEAISCLESIGCHCNNDVYTVDTMILRLYNEAVNGNNVYLEGESAYLFSGKGLSKAQIDEIYLSRYLDRADDMLLFVLNSDFSTTFTSDWSISDISLTSGIAKKLLYSVYTEKNLLKVSGNYCTTLTVNDETFLLYAENTKGGLIDAVNDYFGILLPGDEVSISCGFTFIDYHNLRSEYATVKNSFLCKNTDDAVYTSVAAVYEITVGDKSIILDLDYLCNDLIKDVNSYDIKLDTDHNAPYIYELRHTVSPMEFSHDMECFIDDIQYNEMIDSFPYRQAYEDKCYTDPEVLVARSNLLNASVDLSEFSFKWEDHDAVTQKLTEMGFTVTDGYSEASNSISSSVFGVNQVYEEPVETGISPEAMGRIWLVIGVTVCLAAIVAVISFIKR